MTQHNMERSNRFGDSTPLNKHQQRQRKRHLLTHSAASGTSGIAHAVVVKDGNLFLLASPDGSIPGEGRHSFGLFYNDTRYLSAYEMRMAGIHPEYLIAAGEHSFQSAHESTNPTLEGEYEDQIPKSTLGVRWEHLLNEESLTLADTITIRNYGNVPARFPVTLRFTASFDNIFVIRSLLPDNLHGHVDEPVWLDERLCFAYNGVDGFRRTTRIGFSTAPSARDQTTATWDVDLPVRGEWKLSITIRVMEEDPTRNARTPSETLLMQHEVQQVREGNFEEHRRWLQLHTKVSSSNPLINRIVDRAVLDLRILRSDRDDRSYVSAGIPWFATLFGRDSIIVSLQTLAFNPDLAAETLRLLSFYQGRENDEWREEEPGKILHAIRFGEMARAGQIPHTPYYGTVDATPLFLMLMARYTNWTGDLGLFGELRENVERALEWIDRYADRDDRGYIQYNSPREPALINQGWKDSGNAIVNANGSLAEPPIALLEVQGYTFAAKMEIAKLFRRVGDEEAADTLEQDAGELRKRFNEDYWLEQRGHYALARQRGGRHVEVLTSNAGHALWSGIAEPRFAQMTLERLTQEDMHCGWGIRTLSAREKAYNPMAYHLGSVWPHDNGLIAAGLRAYGFDQAALTICDGILEAATYFGELRLPELFCGFSRDDYSRPVPYPVACHPQAWAAGSVLHIIETVLGLHPNAFDRQLRIIRPMLPANVLRLSLSSLRVGDASVNLTFARDGHRVVLEDAQVHGECRVTVEE